MSTDEMRERLAEQIRSELTVNNDTPRWFYISIARPKDEGGFVGGCFIKARGGMEAWKLMHTLCIYPDGCDGSTMTLDINDERQAITERWHTEGKSYRLLSKEEIEGLVTDGEAE